MSAKTRKVRIGPHTVGGGAPVTVQSMCNTDTRDVSATVAQILALEQAGCEIIRVAVPDAEAADAFGKIRRAIHIPLVADIHFDYKLALACIKNGADKIRINPGNIGDDKKTAEVARACADKGLPVRIGVNAGSLKKLKEINGKPNWTPRQWAAFMVEDALSQAEVLEKCGLRDIIVSLKADDMARTVAAYRLFSQQSNIPLHLGITEAGTFLPGTVKSSIALGCLLSEGIGDTIRVSLTEDPVLQVRCAYEILKALNMRRYGPDIISCPTCGRCRVNVHAAVNALEQRIYSDAVLRKKAQGLKIAVMGCAVNGPGEARDADFGIAGGVGEGVWFEKGVITRKLPQSQWVDALVARIEKGA